MFIDSAALELSLLAVFQTARPCLEDHFGKIFEGSNLDRANLEGWPNAEPSISHGWPFYIYPTESRKIPD